jgi:DNA polymerase-4
MDRASLVRRFGQHGAALVDRAHGLDPDPVDNPDAAKSVSHEHTFDVDTSDPEVIERTMLAMAEGVSGRLRDAGVKASTVTVKVRDTAFRTVTRQKTLPEPTDLTEPIWRAALDLARPEVRGKKIRLIGVATSGFGDRQQLGLFEAVDPRKRRATEAADELRRRFGPRAVTRARLLKTGLPAPFERDFGTAAERRGEHAADVERSGRKRRSAAPEPPGQDDPDVDPTADFEGLDPA